jgi:hypothetical protein
MHTDGHRMCLLCVSCVCVGKGIMSLPDAVDLLAPPLSDQEVIYYQSLLELAAGGCVCVCLCARAAEAIVWSITSAWDTVRSPLTPAVHTVSRQHSKV